MSEDLFYNRDRNIAGVVAPTNLSSLNLTPVYGSKASFSSNLYTYETDDLVYNIIPLSINSLRASFDMKYIVNETNATRLANFFESKLGSVQFSFTPDNNNIYRQISGFSTEHSISHLNNNHYEFNVNIIADQAPTLLNWKYMTFLNYNYSTIENGSIWNQNLIQWNADIRTWDYGHYSKYDIIYYPTNENKLNNFYYCSEDHVSSQDTSPAGDNSKWTQEFFFEPDIGFQNNVTINSSKLEFKNSHPLRIKTKNNITPLVINYKFSNITDKQLRSMLHFLENKAGYRRFRHQIPSVYNRPKVFICSEWSHTWNYFNSHDLEVKLTEDPLGVIPRDS
jgi:phage-related protein